MNVLVIGYGKIGQIKASIWRSIGRKVYVYDTDAGKLRSAVADGFSTHSDTNQYGDDLIADISTPALYHLHSLKWLMGNVTPMPRQILIEKPLASTQEEVTAWLELLSTKEGEKLEQRIIVNESYYLSTALEYVANDIIRNGYRLKNISTELSKNRLPDVIRGRFVDETLGSLGIELPHMIAMIERLGIALEDLTVENVQVYRGDEPHNEGFRLNLSAGNMPITVSSYLGDFRVSDTEVILPNTAIIRSLEVATTGAHYSIEFDPVKGLDRYKAKIHIKTDGFAMSKTIILDDDHLTNHLLKIHKATHDDQLDQLFTARNALAISNFILSLKSTARYVDITVADQLPVPTVKAALGESI